MQIAELALARATRRGPRAALETLTAQRPHRRRRGAAARRPARSGKTDRPAQARFQRVVAIDPFDAAAHTALGRMALAADKPPDAVRAFRVALAAGPIDRAAAHADLAEGCSRPAQRDDAKREALPRSKSRRPTSARRTCC